MFKTPNVNYGPKLELATSYMERLLGLEPPAFWYQKKKKRAKKRGGEGERNTGSKYREMNTGSKKSRYIFQNPF